jgi:hypothetical protein
MAAKPELYLAFQQQLQSKSFRESVALGLVPGVSPVVKFGYNEDADTGVPPTVWHGQGVYTFPVDGGQSVTAVYNALDAGKTIRLYGLDHDCVEVYVDFVLGNVIPGVWCSVHRGFPLGSVEIVADVIIQGTGTPNSNVFAVIPVEDQQTEQVAYMIPVNRVGLIVNLSTSINKSSVAVSCFFRLKAKTYGGVFRTQLRYGLQSTGTSNISSDLIIPYAAPPRTQLIITAEPSANTVDVSAEISLYLINTDYLDPDWVKSLDPNLS